MDKTKNSGNEPTFHNYLPEARLAEVAATRRAALARRRQQTDQVLETATQQHPHPSASGTPGPLRRRPFDTTGLDTATIRSIQREMRRRALRDKLRRTPAGGDLGGLPRLSFAPAASGSMQGTPLYKADAPAPIAASSPARRLAGRLAARLSRRWEGWLLVHPRAHVLLLRISAYLSPRCRNARDSVGRREGKVSG